MSINRVPGGKRDQKVLVALTVEERQALDAAANLHGTKRASLAALLIRAGIARVDTRDVPNERPSARKRSGATVGDADGGQVAWLERGRGRPWRAWAWNAGEELRRRYPELAKNNRLPETWFEDDFTRDGLLALALWRAELDAGDHPDPRMELAWLRSMREFSTWLEQRGPLIGESPAARRPPAASWIERGAPTGRSIASQPIESPCSGLANP